MYVSPAPRKRYESRVSRCESRGSPHPHPLPAQRRRVDKCGQRFRGNEFFRKSLVNRYPDCGLVSVGSAMRWRRIGLACGASTRPAFPAGTRVVGRRCLWFLPREPAAPRGVPPPSGKALWIPGQTPAGRRMDSGGPKCDSSAFHSCNALVPFGSPAHLDEGRAQPACRSSDTGRGDFREI